MAILLLKHAEIHAARAQSPYVDPAANQGFDYLFYLEQLGLSSYFSEGRKDGIRALVKRINSLK
jgi:hypothetical protein